ncbi:hypothetical protein B0T14DRAFT_586177 [Immersiella caudata]|uniref:Uncharacterized protein n=1 Tax=Immersiella caudata TaxID=314043 RepID=A0AA39WR75_9PEZI|nr:hypothetical protein B0T14DRAFT_586177 [Immersiella caudata]
MKSSTAAVRLGAIILSLSQSGRALPGSEIFAKRDDPVCSRYCAVDAAVDEWYWVKRVPNEKINTFTAYYRVIYSNTISHTNITSTVWNDIPKTGGPLIQTDLNKRNVQTITYTGTDGSGTPKAVAFPTKFYDWGNSYAVSSQYPPAPTDGSSCMTLSTRIPITNNPQPTGTLAIQAGFASTELGWEYHLIRKVQAQEDFLLDVLPSQVPDLTLTSCEWAPILPSRTTIASHTPVSTGSVTPAGTKFDDPWIAVPGEDELVPFGSNDEIPKPKSQPAPAEGNKQPAPVENKPAPVGNTDSSSSAGSGGNGGAGGKSGSGVTAAKPSIVTAGSQSFITALTPISAMTLLVLFVSAVALI